MPRTLQEILDHQNEIAKEFENYEPKPGDERDPAPYRALLDAAKDRASAEAATADAVSQARDAGYSWALIGKAVGTSGQAARERYGSVVPH